MALESLRQPKPAIAMSATKGKTPAHRIFDAMRAQIRAVFPDDDEEAWQWVSEDYEVHTIERPEDDFRRWLSTKFDGSDEFSQQLVRQMFTIWHEMEQEGFRANDLELYEHQKALFAWIALSTATGVRHQVANLLVRSPYGSGKSLVSGLVVRAFTEVQKAMLAQGADPKTIPTGTLLGLRKEHMLQNAMGQQYAVLQPPYTVDRADVSAFWQNLGAMFGEDFSAHFERPKGKQHPFYDLFQISDDDAAELPTAEERIERYLAAMDGKRAASWHSLGPKRRKQIESTLEALINGTIVLVPDAYNVPQPEPPLPREENIVGGSSRYRGDSAFALREDEHYRVKTTHRHLALDRSAYTTQPNLENPAQFCIAYGTMLTRDPDHIRSDVREEIMRRARLAVLDEAGKYTPGALGDAMSELSGAWPYMVGFTGYDRGIEGWTARSPVLSTRQMIQLKLMKPIAFDGIGDALNPPKQGTEEAWTAYRTAMFRDEKTAKQLRLPQPYELDTVAVTAPSDVRDYAHRIIEAHKEVRIPAKVWCFDPAAGDNRWGVIVNGFNAPKKEGDPKRVLVAPPSQIAEALHLRAECYDILTNMNRYTLDQTRGRLGHIRNNGHKRADQEKARTYFRVQWLDGMQGEAYIREVARMMGYVLDDEGANWVPLQCMIDRDAYEKDCDRTALSKPRPIPDAKVVRLRKRRVKANVQCTPLAHTSPYVIERERKRAEREAQGRLRQALAGEGTTVVSSRNGDGAASPYAPPSVPLRPAVVLPSSMEVRSQPTIVPQKTETFSASVRKNKVTKTIEIVVGADGMPKNLPELVKEFQIGSYSGSLFAKVSNDHRIGIRGKALATVVLKEILRLVDVSERRASPRRVESYD